MRFLLLLLLVGCSAVPENSGDKEFALDSADLDGHDTSDTDPDDTSGPIDPAWYVVRADLSIVGGLASVADAAVSIDVIDADLIRVNCTVELTGAVTASEPSAGIVWWAVRVQSDTTPCATLPHTLHLGVGALHPDARARLGAVNHDDIADSLYGAWLRTAVTEAATAYGYAGTASDLLGDDVATLPPADGTYRLAPLYVVALP